MTTSFQPEYDYLRPPVSAKQIIHEESYKMKITPTRRIRRLFYKADFDEFEKQKIAEFEELLKKDKVDLPAWWNKQEALRWCYSKRLELPQSLTLLKNYLTWSQDPKIHKLTPEGLSALKRGVVYQLGRDSKMRPIMIVDVRKIVEYEVTTEHFINAMVHVLELIRTKMYLPGHVENNLCLIQTDSISLFKVPLGHLGAIISTASNNYPESLAKMYILNPSFILRTSWSLVKNLMEPETADKISFLQSDDFDQLQELIPRDQLEEKYGGTLPNLTEYWPPRLTVPADQIIWNNSQFEVGRWDPNFNYKTRRNKKIPEGLNICQRPPTADNHADDIMKKSQSEFSEEGKDALSRSALANDSFKDCLNSSQFPKDAGLLEDQSPDISMYYSARNLPGVDPAVMIVEKEEEEEEDDDQEKASPADVERNKGSGIIIPTSALLKMNRRQISLEAHPQNQNGNMFCGICRRPDERPLEDEPQEQAEEELAPGKEECVLI